MDHDFNSEFEEEFEDDFIEYESFEEDDENVILRTAVLKKNNMVALLCIKTGDLGAAICRVDPRENRPAVQIYDDADAALKWYNRSLKSSEKNGWNVVYDGLPLRG